MKIGVMVLEGPYQHEAADSAYQFVQAARARGHEIVGVFFYTDGVNNVNKFMNPPAERVISQRWSEMAGQGVPCIACVAGSVYRGMTTDIAVPNVRIAGLGELVQIVQNSDRFISFGD
ncbi:MAG: sulfurtransferase complex subunit TusD [Chloroflexota bacterium]|nr:sulfurtransferase complex subunit TusD [Chloroflexota bacterium]